MEGLCIDCSDRSYGGSVFANLALTWITLFKLLTHFFLQPAPTGRHSYTSSPLNPETAQKSLPPLPTHIAFNPDLADSAENLYTPTAAYGRPGTRNTSEMASVTGSTPIHNVPYHSNQTAETLWRADMSRGGSEPKYHYIESPPSKKKWVVSRFFVLFNCLI